MTCYTFLCGACGRTRRRAEAYAFDPTMPWDPSTDWRGTFPYRSRVVPLHRDDAEQWWGIAPPEWPRCHGRPMEWLSRVQTAAAATISPAERLQWLAQELRVLRHPGRRRWRPALTAREAVRSDVQRGYRR